ncbi:ATP-binding protein [Paeniglutamicibacter gangotriensis]|uniref:Putative ATPase (AAA+ superfamily) n=1 Tax=Paeniglutamicibacter gangotriensis Lz1y TaxID=1276920 RepID=M7NE09_9MICC|nr:ATP-binding protein [Paeniglutamicibacter gangotriensis]EMQ96728.1 putative ATPase (AAA+ superfamily) [Paeniglutamicibacter gangotriensis Lz1y]
MANPFKPTAGAEPPHLIGREDALDLFVEGLEDGAGAPGLLSIISGPRGIGKTALLHRAESIALEHGWAPISDTATPGLLERLKHGVEVHLRELGKREPRWHITAVQAASFAVTREITPASQIDLRERMTELTTILREHGTGLLITVDEIHSVDRSELVQLSATVQHLIRDGLPIAFIGAGIPQAISNLLNDKISTFLRRADPIVLDSVALDAVRDSLRQTFADSNVAISEDQLTMAAQATGGYPFLVQLVGYHVWRLSKVDGVTDQTLSRGIEAARKRLGSTVLDTALADLSDVDRTFLVKMAIDDGPSYMSRIAERMGESIKYVGVYRRRLLDTGIIRTAGHGKVEFTLPYLAEHLRNHAVQLHNPGQGS